MADQHLKGLVAQGLQAMKAGSDVAKMATGEIHQDATHPELKAALEAGNKTSEQWAQRIQSAIQEAGRAEQVPNEIMQAHYDVSKKIRQRAENHLTRDLGIVAAGQLALHYWIASFGTMANYANKLGMTQVAQDMKMSLDEAKHADEMHTALAEKLLQASA